MLNDCGIPPENIGGIEQYSKDLATTLKNAGNIINIICPSNHHIKNDLNFGLSTIKPFGNFWSRRPVSDISYNIMFRKLYYAAKKNIINTDIIHTHNPYAAGFAGKLLSNHFCIPAIMTFHTSMGNDNLDFLKNREFSYYEKFMKRSIDDYSFLVVNTNTLKSILVQRFGLEPSKIKVIPPAVDIERFAPGNSGLEIRKKLKIPNEGFLIIFVGRLVSTKGIEYLIRAIEKIKNKNVFSLIIGEGNKKDTLIKYCKENNLGLEKNIFFLGRIEDLNLPTYYAASDALVLPSLGEGFGIVFLEAWASGKPVIAADTPIIRNDVIRDGITGLICKSKDVDSLAEKIEILRLDTSLCKKLGENGRKLVTEEHSFPAFLKKYLNVYQEAIAQKISI